MRVYEVQKWLLGLLRLAENGLPISDCNNTLPWLLFIFLAIVVLGLIHLAENRASTSNATGEEDQSLKPEEQEQEQPSDLIVYSSEGLQQPGSPTATAHSGPSVGRHRACAFCGNLSTTKCSRCKTARYCSKACQIKHWISLHKYECVETEPVDQERHGGGASRTVKKTKRESTNGSNAVEWNSQVVEVHSNDNARRQPTDASREAAGSSYSCAVCGCAATIRCPRCKSVKYCSVKCLIEDWGWHKVHCIAEEEDITQTQTPPLGNVGIGLLKNSNEEEDNDHSPGPLSLEFYPEGTTNMKPLIRSSQEPTKKAHDVRLRCLEEEVAKSRNEIMFLQSERDEWEKRANFAKERYLNYKKESDHQLFVLKNEKKLISNAEKQAQHVVNNLWERLHSLQIAVEASNTEKGKQEEHIQMLESKCARLKRELQEEREHIQGLTTERYESLKTAQIAMRQLEEKGKELQVERDRVKRLKEDFVKNVAASESRAVEAEEKLHDLEQKIRSTKNKVGVWRDSLGRPAMACAICLTNEKDLAFGCGHMTCRDCGSKITKCPICREQITSLVRLFPG